MIIDFRVRPPLGSFLKCGFFSQAPNPFDWHSESPPSVRERSMPLLLREMKESGVRCGVIWGRAVSDPAASTLNEDVAAIVNEYRDVFVAGFGGICPQADIAAAVGEVDKCLQQLELNGITLEPSFGMRPLTTPDDPKLYPIYQRCRELGGILAFTISRGSPPDQTLSHSNPESIDRVARDFPDLKVVISHACWPWVEDTCGLAFRRHNVYLLPDLYGMAIPGHLQWVEAANTYLQDRMLFGSAYPFLGIKEMVEAYQRLPYKDDVREKVMYKNAARLLGLPQ